MTSKQFEEECCMIGGWLWDDTWSENYNAEVTLTIAEMRFIANMLRVKDRRDIMQPQAWSEKAVKDSTR